MPHKLFSIVILIVLWSSNAALSDCFDVSKGEPKSLEGFLSFRIFPGPPNFQDVQKGDQPEPGYVLKLDRPICIEGDADFADPSFFFDEVQVVPSGETVDDLMRAVRESRIRVGLENPMPAMTGHHHRPLVAWVTTVDLLSDPTDTFGTAATTVEAFYLALGTGDGALAARFVVSEKRSKGPFSPQELSRFYGTLPEPLKLLSVERAGPNRFVARYHFRSAAGACDGRAMVETVRRQGRYFIQSIQAENGC